MGEIRDPAVPRIYGVVDGLYRLLDRGFAAIETILQTGDYHSPEGQRAIAEWLAVRGEVHEHVARLDRHSPEAMAEFQRRQEALKRQPWISTDRSERVNEDGQIVAPDGTVVGVYDPNAHIDPKVFEALIWQTTRNAHDFARCVWARRPGAATIARDVTARAGSRFASR
ncbi:MAG TPA: hypothetical protein VEF89_19970 [Solirubrobacteraceae bacterium]|nr:hypothetical protein [Solirubrobacteraceae bacterium]